MSFILEYAAGSPPAFPEASASWIMALEPCTVRTIVSSGIDTTLTMERGEIQPGPFTRIISTTGRVRAGTSALPVRGAGAGAGSSSAPSTANKRMQASATSGDGALACVTPIATKPVGFVQVAVNGVLYLASDLTSAPCFFASPSSPSTPRAPCWSRSRTTRAASRTTPTWAPATGARAAGAFGATAAGA